MPASLVLVTLLPVRGGEARDDCCTASDCSASSLPGTWSVIAGGALKGTKSQELHDRCKDVMTVLLTFGCRTCADIKREGEKRRPIFVFTRKSFRKATNHRSSFFFVVFIVLGFRKTTRVLRVFVGCC